ncbi:MAG: DegT/DnrJ/EryC1/StrS family aminotransferase [Proteobacteria bacterium]|nr:DegT/DnrJ/EryC1/StrS family aminotransferase [Pseudomonadota bacterium]
MPPRLALGDDETRMVQQVLTYYRDRKVDPGYQGPFESLYTETFVDMMGGGYADAVATGTSALFVALAALELPKGSEVLVSPITDPGTLAAITLNGLKPKLMDSMPGSYNVGLQQFLERVGPNVSGAVVVHAAGQAVEIDKIVDAARANGIKILEDCSQAHFAKLHGRAVGTFGDIAAFSTMYRKAHSTGPSGGVVFTRNTDLAHKAAAYSDRGKPRWRDDFDDRNPATYLFPALNHHTDEISCAIGYASLLRLNRTIINRLAFISDFVARLWDMSEVCSAYRFSPTDSPFYYPVIVDRDAITCTKTQFAEAVRAEGIDLNTDYKYLVRDWPYIQPYLADTFDPPNARAIRDTSFNLYLNENYTEQESRDVAKAISKVEKHFKKG